ncbi:cupin domain-containing protein [Kibdelosporangium philippinense]|uniref:Cupin domain-containing protein n=1 Tax=Kibdelosporangium philippinense TaxID=211113 RepID=A0ABS8Z5S5_9PSEU|nr:cupin domain-containing protein [Kibdelosporangium philippinense]MCE7003241.1 cupin domain-containing protein [Kibdelosporangium philippinense]
MILKPLENRPNSPGNTPFKLLAEDTGGKLSLLEWTIGAWKSGPYLHAHDFDEAFYVVDGVLEIQLGHERHILGPRHMAWAPGGTAHAFANAAARDVTVLTICSPGGLEHFFAAQGDDPDSFPDVPGLGLQLLGPRIRATHAPD